MKRYIWVIIFVVIIMGILGSVLFFSDHMRRTSDETVSCEEISMILPTYGYVPEDIERVLEEMNRVSMEKCKVKVNYIFTNVSDMEVTCNLRLEAGEQIDLMPCMEGSMLQQYISKGMVSPLDDLLESCGQGVLDTCPEKLWEALGKDGSIYAVSPLNHVNMEEGLAIRSDILFALGVKAEEIENQLALQGGDDIGRIDEGLSPLFASISETDDFLSDGSRVSDKRLVTGSNNYGGVFSQCQVIDYEGFGNTLGCVIGESPRIVNLYETEVYKEMLELIWRWQKAGYIYNLDNKIAENPTMVYSSGLSFGLFTDTSEGKDVNLTYLSGYPTECISIVQKKMTSEMVQLGNWVIPQASAHKEAAMKILNLMFTDNEYVRLYMYGIEGVHYETEADGSITVLSDAYTQNLTWMFGNTLIASTDPDAEKKTLEDYANAHYSEYFGFFYNSERYISQVETMKKILDAYLPELEIGKISDIDGALKKMNDELYAAGLEAVMADKQVQLDEWMNSRK